METEERKYLRLQAENLSPRPLQSLEVYHSLDANILVAGSADKNLRFLEVETFEEIVKYEVNKKSVNCVTISGISLNGDDPFIITAGKDKVMQIWSPGSGNLGKDVELPTTEVLAIAAYQGTNSYVLIGTKDSKVILWDINTNSIVQSFTGHRAGVYAVAITSTIPFSDIQNGNDLKNLIIASGSVDHVARTWDFKTGKKLQKFKHKRSVYSIIITEKSPQPLMITAGAEYIIRLWDVKTAILLRTFDGHLARVNSLCLWEDFQTLIISASGDRTLRIHDLITGECLCILQGHSGDVLTVISTQTDANLVSSTSSGLTNTPSEPRSVIVSSSEDLSLIQWDLQQIISDFYYTTGENCGLRNTNPPYLPPLKYIPPLEYDVGNLKGLSKEQRRKLKKDMKREKIMSMTMKYKRARSSMGSMGGTGNDDNDDDDDDEPFVFDGGFSDEDEDEEEADKKKKKSKSKTKSKSKSKRKSKSGKRKKSGTNEEDDDEEEEDEEDQEEEGDGDDQGGDASYFMKLLQGDDLDEPNEQKPSATATATATESLEGDKSKTDELIPPTTVQSDGTQSRRSSWNRIFPMGTATDQTITNQGSAEAGDDITSKIRKASFGIVNSMLNIIGVRSRENSICKVGVEPLIFANEIQSKSRGGSVSAPAGSTQGDLMSGKTQTSHSRATTPTDAKPTTPTPSSHEHDHLDFKHKAQLALTDYHLAQVEDQFEADMRRQEASAKLASRLKRRKTGADSSTSSSRNLTGDEDLVSIKEKKLMQHKLQTNRARQSMLVAKGRAAEALQKRLDEMNQKKLAEMNDDSNVQKNEEDSDDEKSEERREGD